MVLEQADPTWESGTGCSIWSVGKSFLFCAFLCPLPLYQLRQLPTRGMNHPFNSALQLRDVLKETDWGKVSTKGTTGRAACFIAWVTLSVFRAHSHP